jgi:quinol monooxygenase YgiN
MTNALTVIAEIRTVPGKGDALAAFLAEQVAAVLTSEPGCLAYRAHRSTADPDLFAFYETYVDDAAFEVHRQSPIVAQFRQRRDALGLVAGPAKVTTYREIA